MAGSSMIRPISVFGPGHVGHGKTTTTMTITRSSGTKGCKADFTAFRT